MLSIVGRSVPDPNVPDANDPTRTIVPAGGRLVDERRRR
jgi:hypothetical protein